MPGTTPSFVILEHVDSTNNYAMAKVHAGMAKHGDAWFSGHQMQGKGQRGKVWLTGDGDNIALSVVLTPKQCSVLQPFQLSVAIALALFDLFNNYAGEGTTIKWPNDIYWRDRKAAGILIENKYTGKEWKWAVVGTGININQTNFDGSLANPVSLLQVTGKSFNCVDLAKELHELIMKRTSGLLTKPFEMLLAEYNRNLYKNGEVVRLKKNNMVFDTTVEGVSAQGQLLTADTLKRHFDFGEVEWVIP